jgi:lipoyl-dependent peroxiredoxin
MKLDKVLYTAKAKSTGGREGVSESSDGRLKLTLSTPKSLGGNDGAGTNPEQLFAAGYSACFIGALKAVAGMNKVKLPEGLYVESQVAIGPVGKVFGLKVDMHVVLPGLPTEDANALVDQAHQVCPYSNATRGNIEVNLTVGT